ncbi:imidazole glycerol phosphate synthase subunit HisH [Magnetospira sp. QH-2]|uniref:imidazole glycerol phosphate synthase subunit HisH n=1 Tax=Magnetospira sp. (strain QH-2) TaxID=1288970 RepID=UPI00208E5DCD|nr:imidazole glycerol phosphate synthase subunit HisH [Magnetospira sp. QH-2]
MTIADYGASNILSIMRAFQHLDVDVSCADQPADILAAKRLVVPGVGAFGDSMRALHRQGMAAAIVEFAQSGRPLLGICLGMQLLFDSSSEFEEMPGLGLIAGRVDPIHATGINGLPHKIPHVGWNRLRGAPWSGSILRDLPPKPYVYFVHSFAARPAKASEILATTAYDGREIVAAVQSDNLIGTQFHPEKSGEQGLTILANFMTECGGLKR